MLRRLGLQVLEKHQEPVWLTDAGPPAREPLEDFQEHHIGLQGSGLVAAREAAGQIEVMLALTEEEACMLRLTELPYKCDEQAILTRLLHSLSLVLVAEVL